MPNHRPLLSLSLFACAGLLPAQHAANSHTDYQKLRALEPGGDAIAVKNLELHRDAAVITLQSGSVVFYGDVNGKTTGAVFRGEGHLHIVPPIAAERHNLQVLYQSEEFNEDFDQAVFRFTDGTAAELKKASAGPGQGDPAFAKAANELQNFTRKKLSENLDLRLLADVLSPAQGGFFLAALHGKKNAHLLFEIDPNGVTRVAPEEVALLTWSEDSVGYPLAFHRASEYQNGTASGNEHNAAYTVLDENLDVTIEKNGFLSSLATVHLRAEQDGLAVVPLDLYPTLRVSKVETEKDDPLDYVQEKKDEDPDFGVILAKPLAKGETATLKVTYGGKDVVMNEGQGNYYPVARDDWFPSGNHGFGDYATFHMLFHVPKGLQIVATGTKVHEDNDGNITTTEWKTDAPLPVAGFSLGDFKSKQGGFDIPPGGRLTVTAYANTAPPDALEAIARGGDLGGLNTTPMLATELNDGTAAAQVYTNYFGPLPFSSISLTQQSACTYGQSWPMLVYLPICGFFDVTQRHLLGLGGENLNKHNYWTVVTPHEVADQWWGSTVGFRGYRDQWMSEGFADASAAIFLQATRQKPDDFLEFWKEEKALLTEKNAFGFRPVDVGPVTMGFRLSSARTGWDIYGSLVYPKGAYILHMLRIMMWSPNTHDDTFKATMQDFLQAHKLQAATTEDFKAAVERHMTRQMDLDGNHTMDWFFNEYVYGTDLPNYHFEGAVNQVNGAGVLHIKLVQSGVPDSFKMLVPIYFEFASGSIVRVMTQGIHGSNTVERDVPLPKLPGPVKRVMINYYGDTLSTVN